MAQRFILNGTSYHGKGAIKEIATEAVARGFKKAFVCSDPDLIKFGVTKKVLDVLDENNLAYEVYSDIKPNPTVENVKTGVQAFKDAGTDYLIAIGGGSSMDTAKAIGIIINNPEFADVVSLEGVAPTKKSSLLQQHLVRLQRLLSTTLSQIQARIVRWYVLIHMTFLLLQ